MNEDFLPCNEVLYWYDGPIFYVSELNGDQVIVMLVHYEDCEQVQLVTTITDENLQLMRDNKLSIRDATLNFGKAYAVYYLVNENIKIDRIDNIPDKWLAAPGAMLSLY